MDRSSLSAILARAFGEEPPELWSTLGLEAKGRLAHLAEASPLYARLLRQFPSWALWLEEDRNLRQDYRYKALLQEWENFWGNNHLPADAEARIDGLRRWRRMMSLRIAYRSVNGLASEKTTAEELTRLAEFCIRECYPLALQRWSTRLGQPWDDDLDRSARFCVLGLGKLGGEELNFSSDVDVIFLYEGDGQCRRGGGQPSTVSTVECFTKIAETVTAWLSAQTASGFLFRVDARLRPEGAQGPLVRSFSSLENYYAIAGQTWERLALLKARPIAGDLSLGAELLESLHAFRYPRHPPPSLLTEIAAMKGRTEREVVGSENLERNVKSGSGGIREIEFIVQAFQLLFAGRYPFLQTHSTQTALEQLARYELLDPRQTESLKESYWFLRQVEHRLQLREEQQTHTLPSEPEALERLASSLGFASRTAFEQHLGRVRESVHIAYADLFSDRQEIDREFESWWIFFTSQRIPEVVKTKLQQWFGDAPDAATELRRFACGDAFRMVTREQVTRFQPLAATFDTLIPELGRPLTTFVRLGRFAERYASRSHFFAACASNPQFFRVLALLFDRSTFIHELLCAHPEIFDEVLRPETLRQRKDQAALLREIRAGPSEAENFSKWLPLYVRAEQVRYAIAELLQFFDQPDLERALSQLADSVLIELFRREPLLENVLIVALGKHGGSELTLGSDLDLMFIADLPDPSPLESALHRVLRQLRGPPGLGATFSVDLRLRPHGEAGPLVVTPSSFRHYHASSAQLWERQLLTRARVVSGPPALVKAWQSIIADLLDREPITVLQIEEIWRMRLRIQRERDAVSPAARAFKTAAGGLTDHEFFVQIQQLRYRPVYSLLRVTGTRAAFTELASLQLVPAETIQLLLQNYDFLKRVEIAVRRDENRAVSVLPEELLPLARWLGFPSVDAFWVDHERMLRLTRELVTKALV